MHFIFAWRYFKAKKTTNAINIISWITTGVIAFSTMCQVLVLSVFNGFEGLVKSLYANFYTDLRVIPVSGKTISFSTSQFNQIKNVSGVANVCGVMEGKALIQNGELQTVVLLKGVDENYKNVSGVSDRILHGKYNTGNADNPLLVVGVGIENALGIEADKTLVPLTIFLPKKGSGSENPESSISEGNAYSSGSFKIQEDFDNKYVITNLDFVRQQIGYSKNNFTAVEIRLKEPAMTDQIKRTLQENLGNHYLVQTRYEQNATLYSSMELEKWAVFAILILILIIAAFNIVSSLTMLVLEKEKDIAILQSMGADKKTILNIFLGEGVILATIGSGVGILLALLISLVQIKFKLIKLKGNSFLIDYFPISFVWTDFIFVIIAAFFIAIFASWFPARKAANQRFNLRN
ncbi:MAG: FtsX-like permease family protein [Ginsengibacter sp.]